MPGTRRTAGCAARPGAGRASTRCRGRRRRGRRGRPRRVRWSWSEVLQGGGLPGAVVLFPDGPQADASLRGVVLRLPDPGVALAPDVDDPEGVDLASGDGDALEHLGDVLPHHVGEGRLHVAVEDVLDVPLVQLAELLGFGGHLGCSLSSPPVSVSLIALDN